jgi:rsbT antagonist protein RsbS
MTAKDGPLRMAVPILRRSDVLIATIQSALTDSGLVSLRDALVEQVGMYRSRGVIIDLTAVDVLDSFASRTFRDLAYMVRLRGARTVMVGLQPEVAFAMAQLGIRLENVITALDVEEGLTCLGKSDGNGSLRGA